MNILETYGQRLAGLLFKGEKAKFLLLVHFMLPFFAINSTILFAQQDYSAVQTPQRSMYTFIHYQLEGNTDLKKAALPFELAGVDESEKQDLAEKLKRVLDAKGLMVIPEKMPADSNYVDPISGEQRFTPFAELPDIYLEKVKGGWYFSAYSCGRVPALFEENFSSITLFVVDHLPSWAMQHWLGLYIWQHLALFGWILIGFVLMKSFQFFLENYVKRITQRTKTEWDDNLLKEVESPIGYLFLALFLKLTYTQLLLPITVSVWIAGTLTVAKDVIIFWIIYRLVNVLCEYLTYLTAKTKNTFDDQLVPLVRKSLKVFTVIIGVIFILQNNGVNVTAFITGLGIGGLAFALAAKDTLANLFGSVTIFLDRPFGIGDWIKTGSTEGIVEEVGFRSTRIRTFYNSQISVPNSIMANAEIDNLGRRVYRRVYTMLNLTYDTPPEKIEAFTEGIKAIIRANPKMRQDYYEVHFNNFGAHSLDVMVYAFFKVPDWSEELQQKHYFFLQIVRLAKDLEVEFAFPTQTLHIASQASPEKVDPAASYSEEQLVERLSAYDREGPKSKPENFDLKMKNGQTVAIKAGT